MIRVAVVDDQELVRAGFRALLDADAGIEVVAEAGDGQSAVELARSHRLDVMLMDIRMPGLSGIAATAQIRSMDATPVVSGEAVPRRQTPCPVGHCPPAWRRWRCLAGDWLDPRRSQCR